MLYIIREWFSQGLSVPVIAADVLFVAFGLIGSLKITKRKTVVIAMLILVGVYLLSAVGTLISFLDISTYAVFLGAFMLLALLGAAVGLAVRSIKDK